MRADFAAGLTRLLFLAVLCLLPLHDVRGAMLVWDKRPDHERLILTFDGPAPPLVPTQRGLNQILTFLPPGVWDHEARPGIPDLSRSALLRDVYFMPDALGVETRSGDFDFTFFSTNNTYVLQVGPYVNGVSWRMQTPAADRPAPVQPVPHGAEPALSEGNETVHAGDAASHPDGKNATARALPERHMAAAPDNASPTDNPSAAAQNMTVPVSETPVERSAAASNVHRQAVIRNQEASAVFAGRQRISREFKIPVNASGRIPEHAVETAGQDAPGEMVPVPLAPAENASLPGNATRQDAVPAHVEPSENVGFAIMPVTIKKHVGAEPEPMPHRQPAAAAALETPATHEPPAAEHAPAHGAEHAAAEADNGTMDHGGEGTHGGEHGDNATGHADNATGHDGNATEHGMGGQAEHGETGPGDGHGEHGPAVDANGTAELEQLYQDAQLAIVKEDLPAAEVAIENMLRHRSASEALKDDLRYSLADVLLQKGKADLVTNFRQIENAYNLAMYADPKSKNVPEALVTLGYLHLSVGNIPEAKAFFALLKDTYPKDDRASLVDYYWGDYYLNKKDFTSAAEHFQTVLRDYPGSRAFKPSMVGLVTAYTELGFYDKAVDVARDVEKNWPDYYLDEPKFLMAAGYAAMMAGQLERARDYFWTYVNLLPNADDADIAYARIGDLLVKDGRRDGAREIYHQTYKSYPEKEGGLISQMRLAEEGVFDQAGLADMELVFKRRDVNPGAVYERITQHKESPLAAVAQLKLAMWQLWNQQFPEALASLDRFEQEYPGHELQPKVREVREKTMEDWIVQDTKLKDYKGVLDHWGQYEQLLQERKPSPEVRLAVASAMMENKEPARAMEMARPLVFDDPPAGEYALPGLDLMLGTMVEQKQWTEIPALAKRVASWRIPPDRRRQLDYATALAYEKQEDHKRARPLWIKLATDLELTPTQRGYAHYFLAQDAFGFGDMEKANILGQEALNLLNTSKDDVPKIRETLDLLIRAAEKSGRVQDALAWCLEYDGYINADSPDWPAHAYRKAMLYKQNGNKDKWRENLEGLVKFFPDTRHGRLARSVLESARLEDQLQQIR